MSIKQVLLKIGAIHEENVDLFSSGTRDNQNLKVLKDRKTGVIFIDDFLPNEKIYQTGNYRLEAKPLIGVSVVDHDDFVDSARRFNSYQQFILNKKIVDFGCGGGGFLSRALGVASSVAGVELQQNFIQDLNSRGIRCFSSLDDIGDDQDTFFMFHCLEHLPNPIEVLSDIRSKLMKNGAGKIIVEVPHAQDFLISSLGIEEFIEFTLWSQHLILHTRKSLELLLSECGFKNIVIEGVQRYGVSNHLKWLKSREPGGHGEVLSVFETQELKASYALALSKIDANDTLVAIAEA